MKRLVLQLALLMATLAATAQGGFPFIRNFKADEYKAHNMNYDLITDDEGFVFVANFEGLLYYDHAEWRIVHTPGITRITTIHRDDKGVIWTGGYNYIGYINHDGRGRIQLHSLSVRELFNGEVIRIWEDHGQLRFMTADRQTFAIKGTKIQRLQHQETAALNETDNGETDVEQLGNGLTAVATDGHGVYIKQADGTLLYNISEKNGLCSNNVNNIHYDGHGILWGATNNGIFAVSLPAGITHFSEAEGLPGEVLSIFKHQGQLYVGTQNGLFRRKGMEFQQVGNIGHACWQMANMGDILLAATSNGLYYMTPAGVVRQLTPGSTMAVFADEGMIYSGELDGVYLNSLSGQRTKVSEQGKVTRILKDHQGTIWMQNLYGEIRLKRNTEKQFTTYQTGNQKNNAATLVMVDGKTLVIDDIAEEPFPYPQYSYTDPDQTLWLTNNEGKHLYGWKNGKRIGDYDSWLFPIIEEQLRSMCKDNNLFLLGTDDGLVVVDSKYDDPLYKTKPKLYIRSAILNNDSILWGGLGKTPERIEPKLESDDRNLRFTFSLDHTSLVGKTIYRYRLNSGNWSSWTQNQWADFFNLLPGNYTLEVQARDAYGRVSESAKMNFGIRAPYYFRWYMLLLYLILITALITLGIKWRIRRLEMEKIRLENIVQERTAEVVKQRDEIVNQRDEIVKQRDEIVKQKDEIEEKSKSLEKALNDLSNAQNELIRQEKMATVGKLTQGLIDRILNPLNYINNFSKLSEGLVKDIRENIEDEKDNMNEENYEDTMDVLDMLQSNLVKVGEHGVSTTRVLKAMEEMLKDRSGGMRDFDLLPILTKDLEKLRTYLTEHSKDYFNEDLSQLHIHTELNCEEKTLPIHGNPDQLSMTLLSMVGNSVYAIVKKAQRMQFEPAIELKITKENNFFVFKIHDNGIGIEETIIDKIFDPFFTTKPTGKAAGVGLYLSREIIQNHGGDIRVESVKDKYCEFIITIPVKTI